MPIFISYSQEDSDLYNTVCTKLNKAGLKYWDTKSMSTGELLKDQLQQAINECGLCIFLATSNSVSSKWCFAETGAFWGAGKKVIVLNPDNTNQTLLPPQFIGDVWTMDLDKIVKELAGSMLKPPAHPSGKLLYFNDGKHPEDEKRILLFRETIVADNDYLIRNLNLLDDDNLTQWKSIFLGMPYNKKLSRRLIDRLVKWVRYDGGKLILTCFELGERHHGTNINELAYHFGINFRGDVVTSQEVIKDIRNKSYGRTLKFEVKDEVISRSLDKISIFENVKSLTMRNVCSLVLEPGAYPLLYSSPNLIKELEEAEFDEDFRIGIGEQLFNNIEQNRPVIALAPPGLTRKGSVLATGTWDFRGGDDNNVRFLKNLAGWMME